MPPGTVHLQAYPGATTCVIVGPLTPEALHRLPRGKAVLWLAPAGATPPSVPSNTPWTALPFADTGAIPSALERFIRLDARHLPSVLVSGDDPALAPAVAVVSALLEQHHRARVTRQRDGFRWQRHVLSNLGAYVRHPLPAGWAGALTGRPAVVCGAGPSLDVSAARLAAFAERVVILAADSALQTLARHGITADFVVSVDVAKEPGKCLPDGRMPPHVVLSPVSPPSWLTAVPAGTAWFVSGNQITTDWLAAQGIARPPLAVAENCGVTALLLARWLGCAPIHLLGLDLALGSGGRRHTAGADVSLYSGSGFDAAQEYPEVPGNYAPTVPTHVIGDWRALDRRLTDWPPGLVVNVNDRGARLGNTSLLHPDQFGVAGSAAKATWLQALDTRPQPAADQALSRAALERLQATGRQCAGALPALRAILQSGGPAALVARLRELLRDETTGRMLGGFALKLMPHLMPPMEGDHTFWSTQLDELAELADRASAL